MLVTISEAGKEEDALFLPIPDEVLDEIGAEVGTIIEFEVIHGAVVGRVCRPDQMAFT